MTKEDRNQAIVILLACGSFLLGLLIGGFLVKQDVHVLQYQYEQLEEQHNQLTDQHWNLQQDYLKLENQ